MANHEAAEVLNLHSDGAHEAALARAAVHPGSALALLVARNYRGAHSDDDDDDDENAFALEKYHRHGALDAFSAGARLAPGCVVTNAEGLADCRRYEDAQKEGENDDQADDSSRKGRRRDAVKSASPAMEHFAERINHRILPLEAGKLLYASNLGGPATDEARDPAKLLAETYYPYSPRAQLLRAYIDLAPVRALDPTMDKKQLLRHALTVVPLPQAAENFDRSLMVALFHAKLLFVLDQFDAAEGECCRALHIETPNDPNWDDTPSMAALGADSEVRRRKWREGSEILGSFREKLMMLPEDALSAEFQECCSRIEKLWINFREVTVVDYRKIILPLARSYQWIELRKQIPFYLNQPGARPVGFADLMPVLRKFDASSPQTAKIKSLAELPVLLDEQFREDNKCEHCGSLQNIDLFLSNTPHFFTIVLNWLGGSESQDALSEVLAGITSPLDTEFFCRSAPSAAMYAVTSTICYADDRYVCFARDEDKWVIYGFETVEREDSWEHLLERFKDCKLQPEVLIFEVIK